MAKIFYTADWHLGSTKVLEVYNRPFRTAEYMNRVLVQNCNLYAAEKADIVIHVGDFACFKKDRDDYGLSETPNNFIKLLRANFINIEGNHDSRNKVKSIGKYLRTSLGPFIDVSVGHYPSSDPKAEGTFKKGDIRLCGHVHNNWKYFFDKEHLVLNVNVGVDVWDFRPISEDELVSCIRKYMNLNKPKETE